LKDYGLITSPAFILMKAADPRRAGHGRDHAAQGMARPDW
jgi:hypothetical protein